MVKLSMSLTQLMKKKYALFREPVIKMLKKLSKQLKQLLKENGDICLPMQEVD
jgi:hypothetical protein